MNAYMLSSQIIKRVYIAWVMREKTLLKLGQWTPEYQHAFEQVRRMQNMYDSLEGGKIIYLWDWHKLALNVIK